MDKFAIRNEKKRFDNLRIPFLLRNFATNRNYLQHYGIVDSEQYDFIGVDTSWGDYKG